MDAWTRVVLVAVLLLAFTLTLANCSTEPAPTDFVAQEATPEAIPSAPEPVFPTDAPTDTPEPTATPAPLPLVILHTNDNWGETEPCG
jgi:hypothetical protein